jgi:hypothetical protein
VLIAIDGVNFLHERCIDIGDPYSRTKGTERLDAKKLIISQCFANFTEHGLV